MTMTEVNVCQIGHAFVLAFIGDGMGISSKQLKYALLYLFQVQLESENSRDVQQPHAHRLHVLRSRSREV